ncbi:Uncharacterized protein SCF082_LOCUS20616 [Durusdinium trenchii]|uniref:Uncharacterized protein n=1 Tax=Durusdinium trenchii TaxID=1381693 RepID=A0ABP0L3I2_9DINO
MCEPKRASGNIEVPKDVFEKYQAKGATREKLFEAFIKTGGEKEQFIKVVQLEKSVEQINQLETEGGFYTEKEMKDVLKFTATPGKLDELDPNIVLYWANTRVKGTATNRQASKLKETVSAEGVTDKFQQEVIPSKLDLRSHGFDGPSEKEAKVTQVNELEQHMEEILQVLNKVVSFREKSCKTVDALHKDLNNVYDQFTDMQGDLKVGKCKIDEENLTTWTATEKKFRPKPQGPTVSGTAEYLAGQVGEMGIMNLFNPSVREMRRLKSLILEGALLRGGEVRQESLGRRRWVF